MGNWIAHALGMDNLSGPIYGFWSGFGSDMSEMTIAFTPFILWRRHNCHVHGCWRIGRHQVSGTEYVVCKRHDPHGPVTAEQIAEAHAAAMEQEEVTP